LPAVVVSVVVVVLVEAVLSVLVGAVLVVLVVGGDVKEVVGTEVTVEVVVPPPLSAAITTRATTSPSRIATSTAIAHFMPELMPPFGGCGGGA